MASHMGDKSKPTTSVERDPAKDQPSIASKSKFRFKSKSKRNSSHQERAQNSTSEIHGEHERVQRHRRRSHRRPNSLHSTIPTGDPPIYGGTSIPNTFADKLVDPDVAFRESLFDAMADDEGAQFWEGVYGQPIHNYANIKVTPKGDLEQMTDEEYTAYVRAKMYEKTHQHQIDERARRDSARLDRERLAREGKREQREAEKFHRKLEESLKRGKERRTKKIWAEKWATYTRRWESLGSGGILSVTAAAIPWPVETGSVKDIGKDCIERFFLYGPSGGAEPTESQIRQTLKLERVRWHPDKIQQKLGGQNVDGGVLQAVTAVFQIIDRMWTGMRDGKP